MISRLQQANVVLLALALSTVSPAHAQESRWAEPPVQKTDFLSQADDLKWELAASFTVITYAGFKDWKWGTASFRFQPEGWFGMDTGWRNRLTAPQPDSQVP